MQVPSSSMETTIMEGDRLFGSRVAYTYSEPKRGDVVVFRYPDDETVLFTKRVIGCPGEEVEGRNGYVYINNEKLEEPYVKEKLKRDFKKYKVPEDCYFVLGDNRNNSLDSRYWKNTFVKKSQLVGRLFFRYFPINKMCIIS